jgi:molybdate transport system ATP-binding protein
MGLSVKLLKKVKGFTLDVEWEIENELAILFGGSGAGKSMTLQLIAGLMDPDDGFIRSNGSIFFNKMSGINISPQHRSLGYVFQDRVLFPHMTVKENIAYGLKGESEPEKREQKVKEMIRLFLLQGLEDMYPSEISGGQKQRVALARALIGRPKALLLDEPFSALDNTLRLEMMRLLQEIRAEFEVAVVLVTHDVLEAYSMGDSIIVYSSGRVEQVGKTEDVFRRPKSRKVAQSLGAKNLYKAKVLGRDESSQRVILGVNGLQFHVPKDISQETFQLGTEVDLFIRPEEVMIIREGKPVKDSLKRNIFEGQILDIINRGRYRMVYFQTLEGKIPFEISIPNYAFRNLNLSIGGITKVALREESLWVMP